MNMNWLESLLYGLLSGISEFLPVSSDAHQQIMLHLFGIEARDPVRDLFVRVAMLIALFTSCRAFLDLMKRERSLNARNRHGTQRNLSVLHDWRLVQGAILPMLISMLLLRYIFNFRSNLIISAFFLLLNGVILFVPERMMRGNKDSRSMSAFDSVLIGCAGAISVFSGFSRIGCTYSISIFRGASKKHALTWSLILSIYAISCLCVMDLIAVFAVGVTVFWSSLHTYILSAVAAYLGSCIGIAAIRFLITQPSNNGLSYYCWGTSLFSVVLYLTVA